MHIINATAVIDRSNFSDSDIFTARNIKIAQIDTEKDGISSKILRNKRRLIIPGLTEYLREGVSAILLPNFLEAIENFKEDSIPKEISELLEKSGLGFRRERSFHRDKSLTPLLMNKSKTPRPLITLFTQEEKFYHQFIDSIEENKRNKILGAELQSGDALVINGKKLHAVMKNPTSNIENSRVVGTFLPRL